MQTLHHTHRELGIYFLHSACKHPRDAHGSSDDTWVSLPVQINRMMVAQGLTDRLRKDGMEQPWVGIIIQDLVPSQPHTWPRIVWHSAASFLGEEILSYNILMSLSWTMTGRKTNWWWEQFGRILKGPQEDSVWHSSIKPQVHSDSPSGFKCQFHWSGQKSRQKKFSIENVFFQLNYNIHSW